MAIASFIMHNFGHKGKPVKATAQSLVPRFRRQWQFIELRPGSPPSWVVFAKNRKEPIAMGWFNKMDHFVDDRIFEEILWLRHELRI